MTSTGFSRSRVGTRCRSGDDRHLAAAPGAVSRQEPDSAPAPVSPPGGGWVSAAERWLLERLLRRLGNPAIRIVLWDGQELATTDASPAATVRIRDRSALLGLLANPALGFGDAYSQGRIVVEGDLLELLQAVAGGLWSEATSNKTLRARIARWLSRLHGNTIGRSRRNVHHHYDITETFYRLWLDEQLVYTGAYFSDPELTLEEAQRAKMDYVCRKLRLRPGEHVVEAGFGWGALALHMARHYGVRVDAYNLSREQVLYARRRAEAEGLDSLVTFIEDDYRRIAGKFDVFVSVGMLEHVGRRHYRQLGEVIDRCLKPVSLRNEPLSEEQAERVRKWRSFFLGSGPVLAASATPSPADGQPSTGLSGMVSTEWLASNLARPELKLIDVRPQPDYNTAHIAGSVCLNPESFRGVIGGVSSMLLPGDVLASLLSLMGIKPSDTVVLVPGDSIRDATLVGMGLDRLNHRQWAILDGGFDRWSAEDRPVDDQLPAPAATSYPAPDKPDWFTVDAQAVLSHLGDGRTVIVDTRPADYYRGEKSDERRAGHIPGAVNRPYKEDLQEDGQLKPLEPLADAYATLIPSKDTPIIVHCRTGHQASQTYFVLKRLLGYRNVRWYDAGWTEWSARAELPVAPQGS